VRAKILAGVDRGSVLVVAEAGFGKTTAVEDAHAGSGIDAAWVRCGGPALPDDPPHHGHLTRQCRC
jgi:hypothetical protein